MSRATTKDVFLKIERRFKRNFGIDIKKHIADLNAVKVGPTTGHGITFAAKNHVQLVFALQSTRKFRKDNRGEVFGAVAAAATKGEGWREIGAPSLHCQIAKSSCNIHIDRIGFVAKGPNGETYYGPDALLHIPDELVMPKLADAARRVNPILGDFVSRIHPVLPSRRNGYALEYGGSFEIASGENTDLTKGWELTFDLTKTCKDLQCRSGHTFAGLRLRVTR